MRRTGHVALQKLGASSRTLKTACTASILAAALTACLHVSTESIPKEHRTILPAGNLPIAQWTPGVELTDKAEHAVFLYLRQESQFKSENQWNNKAIPEILKQYSTYYVQFMGTVVDGRHRVLCNYFLIDSDRFAANWQREFVSVLDGGWAYWQIEYDVETGQCVNLRINGEA